MDRGLLQRAEEGLLPYCMRQRSLSSLLFPSLRLQPNNHWIPALSVVDEISGCIMPLLSRGEAWHAFTHSPLKTRLMPFVVQAA